ILHFHQTLVTACGKQCGFVDQVGQISARETRRATGQNICLDVASNRHFTHVYIQDLFATTDIRQADDDLTVKTPRTQQRLVQHVSPVGCGNHDNTRVRLETVHLDQHLVQRLFTFVIATAHASAAMATDCVDLVDEDDARRMLLGILEHVTYTRRTHTDKHFYKVGTGNREERDLGFASN